MPRDRNKDNAPPRGRRDRPSGGPRGGKGEGKSAGKGAGKDRAGVSRGGGKTFAKRAFGDKSAGGRGGERPYRAKSAAPRSERSGRDERPRFKPREDRGDFRRDGERPKFSRSPRRDSDERPARGEARADRAPRKDFRSREGGGEKRPYAPRGDRPAYGKREDQAPRHERSDARPAGRSADRKFGDKKFGDRKFGEKRPYASRDATSRRDDDRPKFSRSPRKEFGDRPDRGRGADKPWQKRDATPRDSRPPRDERGREDRPKFGRPREDRRDAPRGGARDRDSAWQEHPRSEGRRERITDRPRRDNEDDSKVFAKRPAFGGRGAYRERKPDDRRKPAAPPAPKKSGERIAKLMARAGLASRRDAEEWVKQGRVTVNGRVINSPALDITANDVVKVDGAPLPERERTRLFLYHKPRGLMTTHADPEGRPTVFDHLPEGLPRLISIGRLDFNTEGLLLLTNDGGLARVLELPDTGWLRRYRVRAHGEITQAQLDGLRDGVEVDGVKYGPVEASLEREQGSNVWITIAIREGKNREVRNILGHLGLEVNRLIRVSYGPFQLGEIAEGEVEEVRARVLRQQLGDRIAEQAGVELGLPVEPRERVEPPRKEPKPRAKRSVVEDRKGRKVVVQRTGSEEARAHNEAIARGRPQRPKRGYHGKRDLKPRD